MIFLTYPIISSIFSSHEFCLVLVEHIQLKTHTESIQHENLKRYLQVTIKICTHVIILIFTPKFTSIVIVPVHHVEVGQIEASGQ